MASGLTLADARPLFDAMSDAICAVRRDGTLAYANAVARAMLLPGAPTLEGRSFWQLIDPASKLELETLLATLPSGEYLGAVDIRPVHTQVAVTTLIASLSTTLAHDNLIMLSLRDVSAERALESELRATTEFLERLIDSTVDAIIAADLRGKIIVFNQGAERLFGYRAEDVVGLDVETLYGPGVARQVMRMLRSTSYGGVGRLEKMRREVRAKSGELLPVSLTASIIYEGEQEVATVGIMTDLRDRITMEQRLIQAQHKLQATEKQALVAEIAAATAHELNQPLTSIMAYAELILRQSSPDSPHLRAVNTIMSESERMAAIVKKIGRITSYETVDYVGSTKMLDLSKASRSDPSLVIPEGSVVEVIEDEPKTGILTSSPAVILPHDNASTPRKDKP